MGFWKAICSCVACVTAVGVCVLSAGTATPFITAAAAPWLIGGGTAAGYFIGNEIDKEVAEREKRLEQNQRYKDAKDEINKQIEENNRTRTEINDIIGKINGTIPRKPNETDEYLNNILAILTGNLHKGEARLDDLRKALDIIRKELGGSSLMSFLNKLGITDKVMIVGGIVVVIFLLKG